ncbi:hypothetical protein D3C78_1153290 [compost metagenome]
MAEPTKAGKGYRSPVNLRLPQVPTVQDEVLFTEFLQVYNACHSLNAYIDTIREYLEGGTADDAPSDSMQFTRSMWMTAGEPLVAGDVVSLQTGKVWKGSDLLVGSSAILRGNRFTGLALSDAETGEKVRFGVGPAIVEIPGFKADQLVWAPARGELGAGSMFNERVEIEGESDPLQAVIGFCIEDNYVIILTNFIGA